MKDNRQGLLYTQSSNDNETVIRNQKVGISISNTSTQRIDYDSSNPNRESEIPLVVPNIPMQQAVAAKRKSRKIAITVFIIVCLIVLAAGVLAGLYVKSEKFTLKNLDPAHDLLVTKGNITYSNYVLLNPVDIESFDAAVKNNNSLDAFEGATIRFYGKPALIGYEARIEDETVAKVVAGKIYGLKVGSTSVAFYSQDGQTLVTKGIDVRDSNSDNDISLHLK